MLVWKHIQSPSHQQTLHIRKKEHITTGKIKSKMVPNIKNTSKLAPWTITLPETNSSPLKMDAWNTILSYWGGLFSGAMLVSGRVASRNWWATTNSDSNPPLLLQPVHQWWMDNLCPPFLYSYPTTIRLVFEKKNVGFAASISSLKVNGLNASAMFST